MKKFSMIFAILATIALLFVGCDDGGGGSSKKPVVPTGPIDLVALLGTDGTWVVPLPISPHSPFGYSNDTESNPEHKLSNIFGTNGAVANGEEYKIIVEFTATGDSRDVTIDFTNTAEKATPDEWWSSLTTLTSHSNEGLEIEGVGTTGGPFSGEKTIVIANAKAGPNGNNFLTLTADNLGGGASEDKPITLTFTKFTIERLGEPWVCACPTCAGACPEGCTEDDCVPACSCGCNDPTADDAGGRNLVAVFGASGSWAKDVAPATWVGAPQDKYQWNISEADILGAKATPLATGDKIKIKAVFKVSTTVELKGDTSMDVGFLNVAQSASTSYWTPLSDENGTISIVKASLADDTYTIDKEYEITLDTPANPDNVYTFCIAENKGPMSSVITYTFSEFKVERTTKGTK